MPHVRANDVIQRSRPQVVPIDSELFLCRLNPIPEIIILPLRNSNFMRQTARRKDQSEVEGIFTNLFAFRHYICPHFDRAPAKITTQMHANHNTKPIMFDESIHNQCFRFLGKQIDIFKLYRWHCTQMV